MGAGRNPMQETIYMVNYHVKGERAISFVDKGINKIHYILDYYYSIGLA